MLLFIFTMSSLVQNTHLGVFLRKSFTYLNDLWRNQIQVKAYLEA